MCTALKTIIESSFVMYKGCILERKSGGYQWGSDWFSSIELAKSHIEDQFEALSKSINRVK